MPIAEDIARSLIREQESELRNLTPEERGTHINKMVDMLSEKTDNELISFISTGKKGITPETQKELTSEQERFQVLESQIPAGASPISQELERTAKRRELGELETEAGLQELGVSTREDLPAGDIELGFGVEPVEALTGALSKHFNKPVTAFKKGKDILYIDPNTSEIKKANPNILGQVGKGLPLAGDIVGTIGGGVVAGGLTKTPAGVVAGEATGSGLLTGSAEYLRLLVGKSLGAHDLTNDEMRNRAMKLGGIAAVTTGITGGIVSGTKGLRNFLKGRVFDKASALKHGLTNKEADAVISEVNKILGEKEGVRGTLFTRTGDVVVGAKEAEVRRNISHAADFVERDLANQQAAARTLEKVTKPTEAEGGKAVQEVIEKQITKRLSQAEKVVSENVAQFEKKVSILGKTSKETVGEPTRKHLLEQTTKAHDEVQSAWKAARDKGGFNEKTETYGIPIAAGKETNRIRAILERRAETAFTNVAKKSLSQLKGKSKIADLEDLGKDIGLLKAEARAARKNKQFGTPEIKGMEDMIHAMESDRAVALVKAGKEDVLKAIQKAEEKTAKFHETYNRSIVGALTKKNEQGIFEVQSKEFVDKILKGDPAEAKQLLEVIGAKPSLVAKWKEGLSDTFKRDVIDKLKVKKGTAFDRKELLQKTDDWLKKNNEVLEQFFTKAELGEIKKTGDFAVLVKKQIAQQEKIIKDAGKRFGRGKLTSLDPKNLVKFVTGKSGSFAKPLGEGVEAPISKIRYIKNITQNHPAAWREFQKEYSTSIRNAVVDADTKLINPKKLGEWVNTQKEEITEVMGKEYAKDLRSVNKVVQLLKTKPKILGGDELSAVLTQGIRSVFAPPLTREGRAFTAAKLFQTKVAHDVIAKALLDPSTMKQVAKLAEHKTLNREAAELAVSLGFITE